MKVNQKMLKLSSLKGTMLNADNSHVSMSGGGGVCGASLISDQWLVTAGHRAFNVFSMAAHL